MDISARHLAFHGTVVLLFGLLCGGPYARAINHNAPAHIIHSWRVAHASLVFIRNLGSIQMGYCGCAHSLVLRFLLFTASCGKCRVSRPLPARSAFSQVGISWQHAWCMGVYHCIVCADLCKLCIAMSHVSAFEDAYWNVDFVDSMHPPIQSDQQAS
jgi:hypothetical protein